MRTAIMRSILHCLRRLTCAQTFDILHALNQILHIAWGKYYMELWACNKSLSSLNGKEILGFIKNIDEVVLLEENFAVTEKFDSLCEALWYERHYKESKNASKKDTNNKGNVAIQGMKTFYDEFHYS
eukprot:6202651-Ditylum_brightwellii.AAC.1